MKSKDVVDPKYEYSETRPSAMTDSVGRATGFEYDKMGDDFSIEAQID